MLRSLKQPLQSWAHACRGHKTVVFILDEFDLFAKPFKQTVLYNLLDALQASSVQASLLPDLTTVRCWAWSLSRTPLLLALRPAMHTDLP